MIIINPTRWKDQTPPQGARLNYGHPLAKGLTWYTVFNAGAGYQKTLLPSQFGPSAFNGTQPTSVWNVTPGGYSQNWQGGWSYAYERGPWVEPANGVSLMMRARRTGTVVSDCTPCSKTFNNGASPFVSYSLSYNPTGGAGQDSIRCAVTTGGTFHGGTITNLPANSTNKVHTFGMTYTSGAQKSYFNGINQATDATTGSLSYDTTSTGRFIISGNSGAAATLVFIGNIYYVAVWNRVLTPMETEWLHVEPYAFLTPYKYRKQFSNTVPRRAGGTSVILMY